MIHIIMTATHPQSLQIPLVLEAGAAMGCSDTIYLRFEERE